VSPDPNQAVSARRVDFGELNTQPRLYILKIALSAWRRKSASTRFAEQFMQGAVSAARARGNIALQIVNGPAPSWVRIIRGAGSAEGLAHAFGHFIERQDHEQEFIGDARIVLVYDEFRRFEKKARGEGSVLISAVNELFDCNEYSNVTKQSSVDIQDGHLGFLSNTTENTFRDLVDAPEMMDIGFLNRFFLVGSNTRTRRARPKAPPESTLKPLQEELADMLTELPPLDQYGRATNEIVIQLTPEADKIWESWYLELPETETTARLDALGMRLMALLAFVACKRVVDAEIMQAVLNLLEYQRRLREIYRPVEGKNPVARMEEKILQQLKQRGALTRRELRAFTNAGRDGIKVFDEAVKNLKGECEIAVPTEKNGNKTIFKFSIASTTSEEPTAVA
jgi:hypothetical protein